MGGGENSRIPTYLATHFDVYIKTYPFDPEKANALVHKWAEEFKPDIVIGESLGSIHALTLQNYPVFLVSPALNAPIAFSVLSFFASIPLLRRLLEKKYDRHDPRRQQIIFSREILKKWPGYRELALKAIHPYVHAFIGVRDTKRRSGIVSLRTYRKIFGDSFTLYEGSHYMEENFLESMLVPALRNYIPSDLPQES